MPIPLGILAAAGIQPAGAAGAYELIETVTVSGSSTSSITFSNLNTYSSTYQHLQVRMALDSSANASIKFRLNGDSANNYAFHRLEGNGSSVVSAAETPQNAGFAGYSFSGFMSGVIDLLDPYETSKNKTVRTLSGTTDGGNRIYLASAVWLSTNAITSFNVYNESGNYVAGSRFSIYGLKAS